MKKNTIIYLKSILGWFFDLPHCSEMDSIANSVGTDSIDACDLVDESIFELCPCLKDVNTLLSTCRLSQEQKDIGSFRHITPVSINVDPQARIKNKEKELQLRLEEELVKSQPSSTRRVLEMVIERVTSAAVRELTARELTAARTKANEHVARAIANEHGRDHASLLATVTSIYNTHLQTLRTAALESARAPLASRTKAALTALLPTAPAPLQSVACRAAKNRLNNWINDHWNTTAVLCKDIESEMKTLLSLNEMRVPSLRTPTVNASSMLSCDESPATVLIHLKEHICLVLEGAAAGDVARTLAAGARACGPACKPRRAPALRAALMLSLDLCLVYVSKKPKEVNESFLQKLHEIWNVCCPDRKHNSPNNISTTERREDLSPELRNYTDDRLPTPISDEETEIVNGVDKDRVKGSDINTRKTSLSTQSLGSNVKFNFDMENSDLQIINPNSPIERGVKLDQKSPKTPISKLSPKTSPIVTPLKRITPKSKIHPQITINTQTVDPNSKQIHPNSRAESKVDQNVTFEESSDYVLYFDRILCPRNIMILSSSKCNQTEVWEALAFVIVFLLKNDYLCEDSLTEQCLAVYRQDWPQSVLENLSSCMKAVSSKWSRSSTGKFTLFLDFLAEYCGNMDYEITE